MTLGSAGGLFFGPPPEAHPRILAELVLNPLQVRGTTPKHAGSLASVLQGRMALAVETSLGILL